MNNVATKKRICEKCASIKESCERCGSKRFLVVHHRDHDRQNNDPRNLEHFVKAVIRKSTKCGRILLKV